MREELAVSNINTWKAKYQQWIEEHELWELTDPTTATFKAGTVDDAIVMARGSYIPEGILPEETDSNKD